MAKKDLFKKAGEEVFKTDYKADLDFIQEAVEEFGLKISGVMWVSPEKLRINRDNQGFFRPESAEDTMRLREDIKERGVLVPLIVRSDFMVLAGHRRFEIAKELGLKAVPVQRVLSKLTPAQERRFLLKDNVLRRQLTPDDKKALIREIYGPELDLDFRGKTGDSPAARGKSSIELLPGEGKNSIEFLPLPERIEAETGIPAGSAMRYLAEIRKEKTKAAAPEKPKEKKDVLKAVRWHLDALEKIANKYPENKKEILKEIADLHDKLRWKKKK